LVEHIEQQQNVDNIDDTTEDEEIETKIKECQRENGRCMVSVSKRLQIFCGDEKVSCILRRLSQRRDKGNNYQEIFSL